MILFDKAFKCDNGVKLLGYVGTNAVQNYIILCNAIALWSI
jgi:hypothetical protein